MTPLELSVSDAQNCGIIMFSVIIQSDIMLSVVINSVIIMSLVLQSVFILSVIILSVIAPPKD